MSVAIARRDVATITGLDREVLRKQETGTLAKWWHELNGWGWPPELPNTEDPDSARTVPVSETRRGAIMAWIEREIGMTACLREGRHRRETGKDDEKTWAAPGVIKVRITNTTGHPAATQIVDEEGKSLVETGRVLWPIDIHMTENCTTATLRVECDDREMETLLEASEIDVTALATLCLRPRGMF